MSTKFTNNASSKLTQALTADATSMHIQAEDVSKFPVLGAEDFCRLTIVGDHGYHEIVKVTSISSDGTCTIERAQESTTAKEWPIENKVELRITAEYLNSITTSEDVLSLVSPIEEDISNINNNITNVENDILNIENKHASDIEAVNASITAVQENIENNISVSISNLEQSIADTNSSLESSINSVKEEAEASYVKKIGDTMTGSLNIKASNPLITESSTSITKGTTPAENVTSQIKYTDKDGNLTGAIINTYLSEGSIKSALLAVDPSSDNTSELAIKWKDGAACGYAPSPNINASGIEITTASWVNTKLSKYLPLTGGTVTGPIISGEYKISGVNSQKELGISVAENSYKGAGIYLHHIDDTRENMPGSFTISARLNNNTSIDLNGRPDGSLLWGDKNIVRSVGGATADSSGNVNAPYLPLTGGTITGALCFNLAGTNDFIGNIVAINDSNGKRLIVDTYEIGDHGAFIELRKGSDTISPGSFNIAARAKDGSGISLVGGINGQLVWGNKNIVRSVNGVGADAAGNVSLDVQAAAETFIGTGSGGFTMPWYGMVVGYVAGGNGQEFRFYRSGNLAAYARNPDQGYGTIRMSFAFFAAAGEWVTCSNNAWYDVRISRF